MAKDKTIKKEELCEKCSVNKGEYYCEDGNCNAFCCSDCFGQNYCNEHRESESNLTPQ